MKLHKAKDKIIVISRFIKSKTKLISKLKTSIQKLLDTNKTIEYEYLDNSTWQIHKIPKVIYKTLNQEEKNILGPVKIIN